MTASEFKYWKNVLEIGNNSGGWINVFNSYAKLMKNPPAEETMKRYNHIFLYTSEKIKTEDDCFIIRERYSKKTH